MVREGPKAVAGPRAAPGVAGPGGSSPLAAGPGRLQAVAGPPGGRSPGPRSPVTGHRSQRLTGRF